MIMAENKSVQIESLGLPRSIHLVPMDYVDGFTVRPGFYEINGATAIPGGVNFTVYSHGASSIELLLFHREEDEPFAVLPFPKHYRIGNVYSMIVFRLNIEEFEYAYRVDGISTFWTPTPGQSPARASGAPPLPAASIIKRGW